MTFLQKVNSVPCYESRQVVNTTGASLYSNCYKQLCDILMWIAGWHVVSIVDSHCMHLLYGKEHSFRIYRKEIHSSTLTIFFNVLVQVINVLTIRRYQHNYKPLFSGLVQLSQTLIHHCKSLEQSDQNTLNTNTYIKLNKLVDLIFADSC